MVSMPTVTRLCLNHPLWHQDKIPSDLKTILTTVDPELKPNIKVAKATGNNAHKLAAKQSLAKVIKHKGDDSRGNFALEIYKISLIQFNAQVPFLTVSLN